MIEVLDISPAVGAVAGTQALEFDIRTDNPNLFVRIIVAIFYPGANTAEMVYAQAPALGSAFEPFYGSASSIAEVVDAGYQRFHFSLLRRAKSGQVAWPDSPQLRIYAFNDAGEEV